MTNDDLELPVAVGFNPADIALDMSKDEKIRVTALILANKFHSDTVVKDGNLYQAMSAKGVNWRTISPEIVVQTAILYEGYIRAGKMEMVAEDGRRLVIDQEGAKEIGGEGTDDAG